MREEGRRRMCVSRAGTILAGPTLSLFARSRQFSSKVGRRLSVALRHYPLP